MHQVLAGAGPGDAITDQALRWRSVLRRWGYRSEIIAEHVHPDLAPEVHRLDGSGPRRVHDADVLLLHYSIWSSGVDFALGHGAPIAMLYHNVTPGRFLVDANPHVAAMCDEGRARLPELTGRLEAIVSDSAFNAIDVRDAGLGEATVVPLLITPHPMPDRVRPPQGDPHLLSVGRVVPNKRLEDALRVHAMLRRAHAPGARLSLVGAWEGFETYRNALLALSESLGADGVRFTGRLTDAERDAVYASASVYLCTSHHEGFCLPLIEALQHGTPVVARAAGAVPETLGDAGIVLTDDDPAVFAEAALEASRSTALRATLAEAARARLAELDPARTEVRMREALAPVLDGLS